MSFSRHCLELARLRLHTAMLYLHTASILPEFMHWRTKRPNSPSTMASLVLGLVLNSHNACVMRRMSTELIVRGYWTRPSASMV